MDNVRNSTEPSHPSLVTLGFLASASQSITDRMTQEGIEREAKRGSHVACSKGCALCCRYLVRISIPEAVYISEQLETMDAAERENVLARFRLAERAIEEAGLTETLLDGLIRSPGDTSTDHREYELAREYQKLGLACPFLVDESCSIYTWRPGVCRQYNVTSHATLCYNPFTENVRRVGVERAISEGLAVIAAELLGEPSRMIPLSMTPLWLRSNEAVLQKKWSRDELERLLNNALRHKS